MKNKKTLKPIEGLTRTKLVNRLRKLSELAWESGRFRDARDLEWQANDVKKGYSNIHEVSDGWRREGYCI